MRVEEKSLACRKDRENEAIDGKYYTPKKKEFVYSDTEETKWNSEEEIFECREKNNSGSSS